VTLAVNTLGVLYIVENGNAVQSMEDLRGTTIVAAGKGSTPEYALRYLLTENGIDPDTDVTIDWKSEHSECVAALASGAATIALLPQPYVTVAQSKIDGLRVALDLTEEWDALDNGSALLTGVIVARREVVETSDEENGTPLESFLESYAESVNWVNENTADAAELIGNYDIVDAAVAEKALPYCNIVCLTGDEMQEKLSGYLQVLFDADPASVGGALPGDDFYYTPYAG
jgi:NitT/TauT family transport system substrate-binding protein